MAPSRRSPACALGNYENETSCRLGGGRVGRRREWRPPYAELRSEAESQPGDELQVVACLPVLKLTAQTLEAGDVVARLEAKTDAATRLVQIDAHRAVAE